VFFKAPPVYLATVGFVDEIVRLPSGPEVVDAKVFVSVPLVPSAAGGLSWELPGGAG
jgi:hypothetical protein